MNLTEFSLGLNTLFYTDQPLKVYNNPFQLNSISKNKTAKLNLKYVLCSAETKFVSLSHQLIKIHGTARKNNQLGRFFES